MTETCTILQILHFYAHFCKDSGISFLIRNLHKWLKSQHSPLAFLCFSADSSVSVQSRPAAFFLVPVIVLPISIGFCVIPWCIWFLFHYNSFLSRSIAFSYTKQPSKPLTQISFSHIIKKNEFLHSLAKPGLVLVSTGVLKLGKPSAGRDRIANRTLKLNANDNEELLAAA